MIYLLDASIYVFRGWFALPDSLTTPEGEPANGFRGFATALADCLDVSREQPLVVCFDESLTTSFRNDIDASYKANRELPPPELEAQFRWCRELGEALGLACLSSSRYEADDLIASVARLAHARDSAVTVVSRDKDLAQVLKGKDLFWEGPGKTPLDRAAMQDKLGFPPERMADYLALVGDPVDNIPGVPGIGAKTAARVMTHFPDLESLYEGIEGLPELGLRGGSRLQRLLMEGRDTAFHARRLTQLHADAPLPFEQLPRGRGIVDHAALEALDRRVGLGQRNRDKLLQG